MHHRTRVLDDYTQTCLQSTEKHMGYRRIDDLLLSMGTSEGTLNPILECDNEGIDEEKDAVKERDAGEEEGTTDTVDREESDLEPI
ncbi:hypothetical protein J1N35_043866 [Gossypium stocksii]|uniref:Uncharacterized protein n=1 Tax=Gossypium stocksii TaxID=47602 RepID=A0A9D3U872_9ROSI|nr:hypothetical protein J1N35_043866 [Gossypium stocksii]